MQAYIITGASRGLGAAIASELMKPGNVLYCISRSPHTEVEEEAKSKDVIVHAHSADLTQFGQIDELVGGIIKSMNQEQFASITLINNAGMIDPIAPASRMTNADMQKNVELNLLAPMLLSASFLRWTSTFQCFKQIVNISSGAGKNPYYGWSHYCASKAGLDMFTKTIALEQAHDGNFKTVSIAPGVVDTDMQAKIRSSSEENFVQVERFRKLKEEGLLYTPKQSAAKIVKLIEEHAYESGAVLDIRDLE